MVKSNGVNKGQEGMIGEVTRCIEEKALNAWPGLQQSVYDGWVLRFAHGYTRRSNSVIPLYRGEIDVERKIEKCEQSYGRKGMPSVFKMLPFARPAGLDRILDGTGYRREAETSVQTCALAGLRATCKHRVLTWEWPAEPWLEIYAGFSGLSPEDRPFLFSILGSIVPECRFVALVDDGEPVSCGIGICEDGFLGIFSLVTAASERNRGFGRQLIGWLADWGKEMGAETAYLQVMVDNEPARYLYASLGFRELYRYWYRVKEIGLAISA
jgi:N-acetylglutamate synthase